MKLAIIILSGDTPEILFKCLESIKQNIRAEYRIYIGYNGKSAVIEHDLRTFLVNNFEPAFFKLIKYDFYNFSILNNDIIRNHLDSEIDYLLFCNNDVILSNTCVDEMIHLMETSPVPLGTIGCRLLYEDGTIQHDGQVIFVRSDGSFKGLTHLNLRALPEQKDYPSARAVIGNTFALCLCKLTTFHAVGGLNEGYKVCLEDVEFNLRCLQEGYQNVTLPSRFWAHHLESYSRKQSPEKGGVTVADYSKLTNFFHNRFTNGLKLLCVLPA